MEAALLQAVFSYVNGLGILPCFWPNVPETIVDGPHIRVSVLPTDPDVRTTCGGSRYTWIVQCAVYVRDGVGQIDAAEYIDQLRSGIPFNTTLMENGYTFRTTRPGNAISPVAADAWFFVPVQFRFETIN